MPENPWMQTAANAGQSAIGGILGFALGGLENKRQRKQQRKLNDIQFEAHRKFTEYDNAQQMKMWEATNYKAQMEQLRKAGLNPALIYEGSGAGGTTQASSGGEAAVQASRGSETIQGMGMGLQMGMMKAQLDLMRAQTEKTKAEAAKTAGVDTANVAADTANKQLEAIILKYTGKEQKDVYELVTSPNREIQAQTYQSEMEARTGVAGTIYELWVEGKLKEQSLAQIESIVLANAKTREERNKIIKDIELLEQNIKGAKIGNVIADLEAKIQSQTGVDKASPAWMKVLARLFVGLTGK